MTNSREYSLEERESEAAAIGYKVIEQLQRSDRVFKEYEPVFAVIQIGAHQFKVSNGDCIYTEKLKFCQVNDKFKFVGPNDEIWSGVLSISAVRQDVSMILVTQDARNRKEGRVDQMQHQKRMTVDHQKRDLKRKDMNKSAKENSEMTTHSYQLLRKDFSLARRADMSFICIYVQAEVEQKRAHAQVKMLRKIAMAKQKSEAKRAATEALKSRQAARTAAQADFYAFFYMFRDELPDTTAQPKLMALRRERSNYKPRATLIDQKEFNTAARYAITSLEKVHRPQLYVEPDLGVPLDLLDLSVYNAPKDEIWRVVPEDEKLLGEDISKTPIKRDGLKRKERPTDKGMSWLVKTQYISPLSTEAMRQPLSEKASKRTHGNTWDDQFVVATFDGAPTADSDKPVHDAHKS
ncbi:hypothetical protein M8C21_001625, partial [Ambrosia artemisiifolia]